MKSPKELNGDERMCLSQMPHPSSTQITLWAREEERRLPARGVSRLVARRRGSHMQGLNSSAFCGFASRKQNPELRTKRAKWEGEELPEAQGSLSLTLEAAGSPRKVAESGYGREVAVVRMFIPRAAVVGGSSPCQFLGTDSLALFPRAWG